MPVPAYNPPEQTPRERALDIAVKHVNSLSGNRDYSQQSIMERARAVEMFARFLLGEGEADGDL